MDRPLLAATFQLVGGVVVFLAGNLIGSSWRFQMGFILSSPLPEAES